MAIRTERLKEVIRETAAQFIQQDVNDPRIGFCTVTHVDLSADLSFATVYVSVFGEEAQKRTTMRGLNDARGMLQARIARVMKTRTTPHVKIELDESVERSFRIIEKIKEARASDPDQGQSTQEPPAADDDTDDDDDAEDADDSDVGAETEADDDEGEDESEEAEEAPPPKPPAKKKRSKRQEKDHA